MARSIMLAAFLASCEGFPYGSNDSTSSQSTAVEGPAQCVRDDDCVLLPSALTCCIECPPVPPFEAAPVSVLDGMLIENETDCAQHYRPCPPIRCEKVMEACVAHATCARGRCTAVSTGCDLPRS